MPLTPDEEKAMPPAQRIAVLSAEIDARLAALEDGDDIERHLNNLKWIAAEIWRLLNPKADHRKEAR
jgi:hypothetical protein